MVDTPWISMADFLNMWFCQMFCHVLSDLFIHVLDHLSAGSAFLQWFRCFHPVGISKETQ